MSVLAQLVIGLWIGCVANALWYYINYYVEPKKYKISGKYRHPLLIIFEHYHWSTILFILGFRLDTPVLVGAAIPLLLDEALAQNHKFAMGSGHFQASLLIEIMILLLWCWAELIAATIPYIST
ncbi:MAG: hypothetical protein QXI05_05550 [Candidatus Bathyarchaeia archaeon]